ncbi:MAG: prepilin-type N-terminal cleavage/methylation domain-containing protein [Proteobacteria bacterium]|nr:prepilin-type N-terminal cleavage/methylation domain-containing protein [Pseudomonadota bacterium]
MRSARGFTLIELMITVAVIAILSAIALPSYTDYVRRGKLTEATSGLSELRLRAEKFFADNRTYQNAGATDVGFSEVINGARYFVYDCTSTAASNFSCTAIGVANQGMSGFAYGINESNTRTSTFTSLPGWNDSTNCWVIKKSESC